MFARSWWTRLVAVSLAIVVAVSSATGCSLRPGRESGRVSYRLPTKLTVPLGQALPGTDVRYLELTEQGAIVLIKGQRALKRNGDSLDWKGEILPGATVDLGLRVAWFNESDLHVVGMANVDIEGIAPRSGEISTSSPISYSGVVAHSLAKGAKIPGSTISFEGLADEGVKLGGIEGYPYRKTGDSIFWEGVLRNGVYIRLNLRVVQYDSKGLRVGGIVTLWLEG